MDSSELKEEQDKALAAVRRVAGEVEQAGLMTPEVAAALALIGEPHVSKKRRTVIKLAFADANGRPLADVFKDGDCCNERVWYQKWQYDPAIAGALDVVRRRALEMLDAETLAIEAQYGRERRRGVARYAAQAPAALASVMADSAQGGGHRINAALALVKLATGESEGLGLVNAGSEAVVSQTVNVSELSDEDLRALLGKSAGGAGGEGAGPAASG